MQDIASSVQDIHNFSHKNELLKKRIEDDGSLLKANKKYILDFINFCEAKGNRPATINKDTHSLWYIARHVKKDFRKCGKKDIVELCGAIEKQQDRKGNPWSEKTKRNHTVVIKILWKWLYGMDEKGVYPDAVR